MSALTLALPRSRGKLRVLCLGAHPDDIEIGCGGTLMGLARGGAQFRAHVLSGERQRAREAKRSADRLFGGKADTITVHAFRDGFFPGQYDAIKETFDAIATGFRPDIVFTHFREDRHQDHRVVSDLTWTTFRDHLILEYEIPKWDGDLSTPNLYVPISDAVARRKVRLLTGVFVSQRQKDWFRDDVFLGMMRLRGVECRASSGYAEAFHARKLVLRAEGGATP